MPAPDLEIHIRTMADLKAAKELQKQLQESIKETKGLGLETSHLEAQLKRTDAAMSGKAATAVRTADSLKKVITETKKLGGDTAALERSLTQVEKVVGGGGIMSRIKGKFGAAKEAYADAGGGIAGAAAAIGGPEAVAAVAAAGATLLTLKKGMEEYAQAEAKVISLDAALANHGLLNDKVRESYQKLAGELEDLTTVADDKWIDVLTRLTQFGVKPEDMPKQIEFVKNLTGITKDVGQSAELVTKALNGEFAMFSRLGVVVPEVGSDLEKLAAIQKQVAVIGGGQMEAYAKSMSGLLDGVKRNFEDAFKGLGAFISRHPALIQKYLDAAKVIGFIGEKLTGVIPQNRAISNSFTRTGESIEQAAQAAKVYADELQDVLRWSNAVEQSLNRQLDATRKTADFEKKMIDARLRTSLAQVDADRTLTPEQKAVRKAALSENADDQKFNVDAKLRNAELATMEQTLKAKKDALAQAQEEVNKAKQAADEEAALSKIIEEEKRARKGDILRAQKDVVYFEGKTDTLGQGPLTEAQQKVAALEEETRLWMETINKDMPNGRAAAAYKSKQDALTKMAAEEGPQIDSLEQSVSGSRLERDRAHQIQVETKSGNLISDYSTAGLHPPRSVIDREAQARVDGPSVIDGKLGAAVSRTNTILDTFTGEATGLFQQQGLSLKQAIEIIKAQNQEMQNWRKELNTLKQQVQKLRN